MKRMMFLPVLCALLLTSCRGELKLADGRKIEPSSRIVKNEYRQPAFDKVDISLVANVKLIQSSGNDHRVVLSCPDNYVELFKFEVEGGELEAQFVRDAVNIEPHKVDVTIYCPQLHSLDNSAVASVEISRLKTDRLKVENSGVGTLYLSGLSVGKLDVDCSGVGGIELGGEAEKAQFDCSGVGSIKAENLKAKTVKAEVSGVGGIRCYASESLEAEVSGVGSLKYGGSPQHKRLQRNGVGDISEL